MDSDHSFLSLSSLKQTSVCAISYVHYVMYTKYDYDIQKVPEFLWHLKAKIYLNYVVDWLLFSQELWALFSKQF